MAHTITDVEIDRARQLALLPTETTNESERELMALGLRAVEEVVALRGAVDAQEQREAELIDERCRHRQLLRLVRAGLHEQAAIDDKEYETLASDSGLLSCMKLIDAARSERDAALERERRLRELVDHLLGAIRWLVSVVDKAGGPMKLANGVELGKTSWYVKMMDAMEHARALLRDAEEGEHEKR